MDREELCELASEGIRSHPKTGYFPTQYRLCCGAGASARRFRLPVPEADSAESQPFKYFSSSPNPHKTNPILRRSLPAVSRFLLARLLLCARSKGLRPTAPAATAGLPGQDTLLFWVD